MGASLGGAGLARRIGSYLDTPAAVTRALYGSATPNSGAESSHDRNMNGAAAAVLLHSALHEAFPDGPWADRAASMLAHAGRGPLSSPSLFYGWGAVGFAASYAAAGTGRFAPFVERIQALIARYVLDRVPAEHSELRSSHEYELIDGLAGVWLAIDRAAQPDAARRIASFFDWLTADGPSRWDLPNETDPNLPGRYNVLGVAHGLGGVLAVLALDAQTDLELTVLERVAQFFVRSAIETENGPQWPIDVAGRISTAAPFRIAWCHSSLGIAVALSNASAKLGDPALARVALASARGIAGMPRVRWKMTDHTLCHGTAGNALLLRRLARAHGDAALGVLADSLFDELVRGFDERLAHGYQTELAGEVVELPGLLMGTAGIGLALLTLDDVVDDAWMRIMAVA